MNYVIYICDTETTGKSCTLNDIIELSLYRLNDNIQKTWLLKPITDNIEKEALRINGHKLEDITHQTKYGKENYKDPNKVIVEIENFLIEDEVPSENRILIAYNYRFDYNMLEQLWIKCNSQDSFPFGRRYIDPMCIEFFLDYCKGSFSDSYSLAASIKKYGIKNEKVHTAESDTKCTKELFEKQVERVKKLLNA